MLHSLEASFFYFLYFWLFLNIQAMAPKSDHRKIKWLEIVTSRISTKKLNKLKRSFADESEISKNLVGLRLHLL